MRRERKRRRTEPLAESASTGEDCGPADAAREEALKRAFRYLAHRPRTRSELERHLARRGYEDALVAATVRRCEELGYVDDRAFAVAWTQDRIRLKPRGVALLRVELRDRGISEEDAEAGIRRAFAEEGVKERELLERAALKRWRTRRSDEPLTVRRRLSAYLGRRGFRSSEIRDVVDRLVAELDGPDAGPPGDGAER